MKQIVRGLIFLIMTVMTIACNFGRLNIYSPPSEDINITVTEVETGNKLVDITETNIILFVMLVGAFLIVR